MCSVLWKKVDVICGLASVSVLCGASSSIC